jgi:copper(I)-binding protein
MSMKDDVMVMEKLERLELPPGQTVKMAPGGMHIMFMDIKKPLVAGETVQLTLKFQNAPQVVIPVKVAPIGSMAPPK